MPSAVDTVTFQNKKSKLLGIFNASIDAELKFTANEISTTTRTSGQSGAAGQTLSVNYAEPKNIAKIRFRITVSISNQGASCTIHVRRGGNGGVILASGTISGPGFPGTTFNFNVIEIDRPVGLQTHTLTFLMSVFGGGGGADTTNYDDNNGETTLTNIIETHSAKNTNIISG